MWWGLLKLWWSFSRYKHIKLIKPACKFSWFSPNLIRSVQENNALIVDPVNDIRIIGCITVVLLMGITVAGMEWEAKVRPGACWD